MVFRRVCEPPFGGAGQRRWSSTRGFEDEAATEGLVARVARGGAEGGEEICAGVEFDD